MIGLFQSATLALFGASAVVLAAPQSPAPSWYKYVRSPSSSTVKPAKIITSETKGNVKNADGFLSGKAVTVLSRPKDSDTPPSIVVDFGQNVVGLLGISFAGSTNGTNNSLPGLKLAFSESRQFLTNSSDFTRSFNAGGNDKYTDGTDQIAVNNSPYHWRDQIGCQHNRQVCADGLHGFRYVRITLDALASDAPYTSSSGSVSIAAINLEWSAYLGTPDTFTGWFECSDKDLTQWWYDGVYTVDMGTDFFLANETEPRGASSPTLEGKQVLFDGAKRDRDPYVGDLAVASLTSYLSHDFSQSSRNVLEDLAQHQRSDGWIPPASINGYTLPLFDYPLWWAVCSVDYVLYTGNTSYIDTYWTALTKVLDGYYPSHIDATTGLVVKADGYGDYAFLPRSGPITYYNALYVHALRYAAQLATSLGKDKAVSSRWTTRADSVASAPRTHNFDNATGAFFDGGPCPGQSSGYCNVHSQDGNSLSVLAGVTDLPTSQGLLDYYGKAAHQSYGNAFYDSSVLSPGDNFSQRVYAFISYFELAARFETKDRAESGFEELRRLYGWMASNDPGITMWEGIGPGGSLYEGGFTSLAHGWSTGVVPVLSNYVLGVKPTAPGFKEWIVCPEVESGGLTWAKGRVPTPGGKGIDVSWSKTKSGKQNNFAMTVTAPAGTKGKVCVPTFGSKNADARVNGKPVGKSGTIVVDIDGGKQNSITVSV